MMKEVTGLFDRHESDGTVTMVYDTQIYLGGRPLRRAPRSSHVGA